MPNNFLYFYQHLPSYVSPLAFSFGPIAVSWYSLMYLTGFVTVYFILLHRLKKKEFPAALNINPDIILDYLLYSFLGLIIGARLGYILFYNFSYYRTHILETISPFDPVTGKFIGLYGMSYHGGLIGVAIASGIFLKKNRINLWDWADFIIPAVPLGYFWGRLGNFMNGELYGRITSKPWGMYFPTSHSAFLRHPSQLYEAFLEGLVLFFILWYVRNKKIFRGQLLAIYLMGYSASRFLVEFYRQPDEQIGFLFKFITMGQILSLIMFMVGLAIFILRKNKLEMTAINRGK